MSNLGEQISTAIDEVILDLEKQNAVAISHQDAARRAYEKFVPTGSIEPHIEFSALQHFSQVAGRKLRRDYDPIERTLEEESQIQGTMFDNLLQTRYPVDRLLEEGGVVTKSRVYLLRESMNEADRRETARLLRKSGESRIEHARALDAETNEIFGVA